MRRCPCGSGLTFAECCEPIISGGRAAATAVALMRSRFTAFAIGDADHLLRSWHPRTRPPVLALDASMTWRYLEIGSVSGGTPFDTTGEVTFAAHYRTESGRGVLRERSSFERVDGRWLYVDGVLGA